MLHPVPTRLLPFLAVAGLLVSGTAAQVQEQTFQVAIPVGDSPSQTAVSIPAFDPSLGTLVEARLSLTPNVGTAMRVENTDTAMAVAVTLDFASTLTLSHDGNVLVVAHSQGYVSHFLLPFDGTLDCAGVSGAMQDLFIDESAVATLLPFSSDLEGFVAKAGSSEPLLLQLWSTAFPALEPSGNPAIHFAARVTMDPVLRVTYRYSPQGAPYCAGDGSGVDCPCDNFGAAGHGCSSPDSSIGARLVAVGDASVSADTLTFQVSHLPASTVILLLQSDAGSASGVSFGAGLQCLAGNVIRIAARTTAGNASVGGAAGDVSVAALGMVPSGGGMRYYQVAYREGAGACNGAPLNLTNGWRVAWRP